MTYDISLAGWCYLIALTVSVMGYLYFLIDLALTDMNELKRRWEGL